MGFKLGFDLAFRNEIRPRSGIYKSADVIPPFSLDVKLKVGASLDPKAPLVLVSSQRPLHRCLITAEGFTPEYCVAVCEP